MRTIRVTTSKPLEFEFGDCDVTFTAMSGSDALEVDVLSHDSVSTACVHPGALLCVYVCLFFSFVGVFSK